jgi:FkbM family methyltransferase
MNIDNFNWGKTNQWYRDFIGNEIFNERIYEKFFSVEEGDIVFDAGASIGIFGYSILNKKPSVIYCLEPSSDGMDTCKTNIPDEVGVFLNYGISNIDGNINLPDVYEDGKTISGDIFKVSKFSTIVKENGIEKIDFLKCDCEGGEYDVFQQSNVEFLKTIPKIVTEFHMKNDGNYHEAKFRWFRDNILPQFDKIEVFSVDGVNIKWDLWNEHFIQYYSEVIVYMDNRK